MLNEIEQALANATGIDIQPGDYDEWLEPYNEEAYIRFDEAATKAMGGEGVRADLEMVARVDAGLWYALGIGDRHVGGVDLKAIIG